MNCLSSNLPYKKIYPAVYQEKTMFFRVIKSLNKSGNIIVMRLRDVSISSVPLSATAANDRPLKST